MSLGGRRLQRSSTAVGLRLGVGLVVVVRAVGLLSSLSFWCRCFLRVLCHLETLRGFTGVEVWGLPPLSNTCTRILDRVGGAGGGVLS